MMRKAMHPAYARQPTRAATHGQQRYFGSGDDPWAPEEMKRSAADWTQLFTTLGTLWDAEVDAGEIGGG
jgi:hypothetical protein